MLNRGGARPSRTDPVTGDEAMTLHSDVAELPARTGILGVDPAFSAWTSKHCQEPGRRSRAEKRMIPWVRVAPSQQAPEGSS